MTRLAVPALAAALCSVACDAFISVAGTVTTSAMQPIAGAQVRLRRGSSDAAGTVRSGADGTFRIGRTHGPFTDFELEIDADGFKPVRIAVAGRQRHRCIVRLAKLAEGGASRADCSTLSN